MAFSTVKEAVLTFRVTWKQKEALEKLAAKEGRTLSNMLERLMEESLQNAVARTSGKRGTS